MLENSDGIDKELLGFALEETNDGWWDWNVSENTFYLSPNYWRAFGYDPSTKNHLASEWQEITHPEDLVKVEQALGEHFETKGQSPYVEEVRFKHIEGHWSTVICRGKTVQWDDDGKPVRFIGVHTDITHLKNKEKQIESVNEELKKINSDLKDSREFQALILHYNPDLIFVKNEEYKIILANDAFVNVYPKDQRDKIIGFTTVENYNSQEAEEFLKKDKEAFENGYSDTYETILFPDGKNRILYTQKILFKNNMKDRFILGISKDVTGLKEQEAKLSQSNEELAQFAYRTSHDLKAPLATIKGLTDFIEEDLDKGDVCEVKRNVKKVYAQASRLETLVVDILNLAKTDLEKQDFAMVNIDDVCAEIKESYSDIIREKNVKFHFQTNQTIRSQKTRLQQIIGNLVANSVKYSDPKKENKTVTVSCEVKDSILISVIDNGVGIELDDRENLFEMFSRFNVELADGSGLGMSIVKKNVDALGGKIEVIDINEGTRFDITLPIEER